MWLPRSCSTSHFAPYWTYSGTKTIPTVSTGQGISNADLVLYISADNTYCGGSTLAFAGSCSRDQYGRPIAGSVNFCASALSTQEWRKDVLTTIHEISHILIMSPNLWTNYISTATIGSNTWITSNNVRSQAQQHFDCNTLQGGMIENAGSSGSAGSHWDFTMFSEEYMLATLYGTTQKVSKFTLAIMLDSGWYQVNIINDADTYTFGANLDCAYFNNPSSCTNYQPWWCSSSNDNTQKCTADNMANGGCNGGDQYNNNCPWVQKYSNRYECNVPDNAAKDSIVGSTGAVDHNYGADYRCINVYSWTQTYYCLKLQCNGYNSQTGYYSSVTIQVDQSDSNTYAICNRGEYGNVKTISGVSSFRDVRCPKVDTVCPPKVQQPFACIWGHYSQTENKCKCSVGYVGANCDQVDNNNPVSNAQLHGGSADLSYSDYLCISGVTSNANLNGQWQYVNKYNSIYSYWSKQVNSITYYIYFDSWYHVWMITTALNVYYDASSVIAFCGTGVFLSI